MSFPVVLISIYGLFVKWCKNFLHGSLNVVVLFEKINKNDQSLINLHNIFCDYLINQDRSKNNEINIIELNLFQITDNFANYLGKKVSEFKNIINFCYHENNVNRTSVETNLSHMYKNIEENLFDNQKNDKKDYKFIK